MFSFMFATGIENSIPTIRTAASAWTRWRSAATTSTGARTSIWCRTSASGSCATARRSTRPGSATATTTGPSPTRLCDDLKRRDIVPIADLCHFGVPDWIGNFQNPDFPELFARLRRAPSPARYPWVQLYTPVNEMFICAHVLGALRLVERAAAAPTAPSSPRSSTSSRPTCWRCRPSWRCGPTRSSSRASRRNTSTPRTRRRSAAPRS